MLKKFIQKEYIYKREENELMTKRNANFDSVHKALVEAGCQDSIRALTVGRMLHYEDDNVDILFEFDRTGTLTKTSIIWYANKFQCLRMVDMTEKGVNNYLKMFNVL